MLTTSSKACWAVTGELLAPWVDWIVDKLTNDHGPIPQIKAVLAHT
jgi:hypothetical protein